MLRIVFSLFVFFLFTSQSTTAQDYTVNWGPELRREGGLFSTFYLLGFTTDDQYHMVMRPRRENFLLSFNIDHRISKTQNLNFTYNRDELQLDRFIETNTGHFAYFMSRDKRNDQWHVLATPFIDNTFGEVRKVFSHPFQVKWSLTPFFGITNYSSSDLMDKLVVSQNKSYVSFVNALSTNDNNRADQCVVAVFDEHMELLWKKTQTFEYNDYDLRIVQSITGDDGSVYLLTKLFDIERGRDRDLPRYDYKVYRITPDGTTDFLIKLDGDKAPTDAGIFFPDDTNQEFWLSGFYTDAERRSGLKGVFFQKHNNDGTLLSSQVHPFTDDFMQGLQNRREERKDRGISTNFDILNFLEYTDGSIGFIAEKNYISRNSYIDANGQWRERITYHSDELITPRFSRLGELINIQKVDKTFRSQSYSATSYSLALANGQTYLLFNDYKNRDERRALDGKGSFTDLCVISPNGEITFREALFSTQETGYSFYPRLSDYSSTHLLFMGLRRKKYAFATIEL